MRVGLWEAELRAGQQAGGMKTLVVEWLTCCSKLPELNREGGEQTKKGLAGRKCRGQWARVLIKLRINMKPMFGRRRCSNWERQTGAETS